jgi:hypothetical protein
MKKSALILFLGLTTILFSCKEEEVTKTQSKSEMITSSSWKISGYSTTATDTLSLSVMKSWNDDLKTTPLNVTYKSNGTYYYSDSSDYGTWELSNDNSILFDKGTSKETPATINTLTSNNFAITYPWNMSSSIIANVTETAVK